MTGRRPTSLAMASGLSCASSQTPILPFRAPKSPRFAIQSDTGTIRSPLASAASGSASGALASSCQVSAAIRRSLISFAIDRLLEGFHADAAHHVDEALGISVALGDVAFDQPFDDVGDFGARERRADDLAQGGSHAGTDLALVAADLDLVPLLSVLVDAEDADVTDVMMAAGIHAARD